MPAAAIDEALLRELRAMEGRDDWSWATLVGMFEEPRDAYVCSPRRPDIRSLAEAYAVKWKLRDEDRLRHMAELRTRSMRERWMEARAVFQARRSEMRTEVILEAETTVWATLGLEFAVGRMRSLWARWEMLSESVDTALQMVANGERGFGTDIKDMCKELRDLEMDLQEMLPKLGIGERAQRALLGKSAERDKMIENIAGKLKQLGAAGVAGRVLVAVDGDGGRRTAEVILPGGGDADGGTEADGGVSGGFERGRTGGVGGFERGRTGGAGGMGGFERGRKVITSTSEGAEVLDPEMDEEDEEGS